MIVTIHGFPIYYEWYGGGDDLVFLHGFICSLEDWRWTAGHSPTNIRKL
jgi:pimeloyl-ACP methyl ester carboxylesterase